MTAELSLPEEGDTVLSIPNPSSLQTAIFPTYLRYSAELFLTLIVIRFCGIKVDKDGT